MLVPDQPFQPGVMFESKAENLVNPKETMTIIIMTLLITTSLIMTFLITLNTGNILYNDFTHSEYL